MRFTVEVETESFTPGPTRAASRAGGLAWDIEVHVEHVHVENIVDTVRLVPEPAVRLVAEPRPEPAVARREAAPASRAIEPQAARKPSSARSVQINGGTKKATVGRSDEDRKLSMLVNPRGRKVTRQGDWLVFTEKVGLLTSQNGVQQVREQRVKINSEDLDRLLSLGF
jgi:hypothetical protein